MKKILYFGNNNPFKHKRGVENVIEFQSEALENIKKYYIYVDNESTLKIFRWKKIICIGIPHNKYRFLKLNLLMRYFRKKNKNNFIIHSHQPLMSFFYFGKIDLMTVHDGLYYQSKKVGHRLSKVFYVIEKIVYKKTKMLHFISNFSKEMSLFKGNNYVKIFNSTPFEKYLNLKISKDFFRKWKSGIGTIKLFTVRSTEERARIDLLIELAEKRKDIEIKVAGKGPLLDFYRNIIEEKKMDNIELLGFTSDEDVVGYYKTCDIVIVPAQYGEGFGLPIIEGYLFDKPVIGSNVCAIPEVIISKEFLFENNLNSIEKVINRVKTKEKMDYQKYYFDNFSYEKIIKKYNHLYKNFLRTI